MSNPNSNVTALGVIGDTFLERGSVAATIIGTATGVASLVFLPDSTVRLGWLLLAVILLMVATSIFYAAVKKALNEGLNPLPAVISCYVPEDSTQPTILMSSPSELFGVSSLVSVYYENDTGFEILLAHGYVNSVQRNGNIQVAVENWEEGHPDVRSDIQKSKREELQRLIVKPSVVRKEPQIQELASILYPLLMQQPVSGANDVE